MKFENIKIQNFLSFENAEYNFSDKGLTLISGQNLDDVNNERSNGSGKSSLLEALVWCLFGHTTKKLKSDDVVNRNIGANTCVELDIESSEAEYKVVRYRQHTKNKNDLVFLVNGIEHAGKNNQETQDVINNTLKIDYKLFLNSVFFPQESKFNFIASTDKEKKEILTDILDLKYLDDAQDKAKKELKKIERDIEDNNLKISMLERQIEDIKSEQDLYSKKKTNWEKENLEKQSILANKIENLKDIQDKLEEKRIDEKEIVNNNKELNEKLQKINSYQEKKNIFIEKKAQYVSKINSIKEKIQDIQKNAEKMQNIGEGECPKCFQNVNVEHIANLIEEKQINISKLNKDLQPREEKLDKIKNNLKKINQILDKKSLFEEKLKKNERKLKENSSIDSEYKELQYKIDSKQETLSNLKKETNPYTDSEKKFKEKINKINKECDIIKIKTKENNDLKRYYDFWKDAFSNKGIKSFIFDGIVEELNDRIEFYLDELFDGQLKVMLDTETKNTKKEIQQKLSTSIQYNNENVSFESLSGGEKRSVVLATDLALSDIVSQYNQNTIDLLILDEVTDFLDDTGKERFLNLLQKIDKNSIFLISHDKTFQQKFNNVVDVVKEHGASQIL